MSSIRSHSNHYRQRRSGVLTTSNGVTSDTLPPEPTAHGPREVMETGLACTVGICFVVWNCDPFNRTNLTIMNERGATITGKKGITHVDDTGRVEMGFTLFSARFGSSSEERQTFLSEGKHSVKVQGQDFGPGLVLKTTQRKFQLPPRITRTLDIRGKYRTCFPKRLQRY